MKILSIDTASNICGVSILENKNPICTLDSDTGRTHSENLMPMIDSAFKKTNFSLNDIDLIVCDKGPGSFTGIRIGIATVKAFVDSKNIDFVGIDSLLNLAYNVKKVYGDNFSGLVCSIIDCKNKSLLSQSPSIIFLYLSDRIPIYTVKAIIIVTIIVVGTISLKYFHILFKSLFILFNSSTIFE